MENNKKTPTKFRYWSIVFYPESAPTNWRDLLQQTGLPCCVSPLHDQDINEEAEGGPAPKKAHWHAILCWQSPTTQKAADQIAVELLNGVHAQGIRSIKGAYRYLTHKDNPEKAQYDEADITCINGFCIDDYAIASNSEVNALYKQCEAIIEEQDFESLRQLILYLESEGKDELAAFVRRNTFYLVQYLKAKYLDARRKKDDEIRDLTLMQLRLTLQNSAGLVSDEVN